MHIKISNILRILDRISIQHGWDSLALVQMRSIPLGSEISADDDRFDSAVSCEVSNMEGDAPSEPRKKYDSNIISPLEAIPSPSTDSHARCKQRGIKPSASQERSPSQRLKDDSRSSIHSLRRSCLRHHKSGSTD